MNNKLAQLVALSHQISCERVQLIFVVLTLVMLILGVGAPSDGGGARRSLMGMLHHHSP